MGSVSELREPFERWSPTAFVVGGGGLLLVTVLGGLDVADVYSTPGWGHMIALIGGLWFVFVGLVGYAPRVADGSARLSRIGEVAAAIGLLALSVALLGAVVVDITTQRTFAEGPTWGPPLLAGSFLLVLASFLVYAVATVRFDAGNRTVGLLMVAPFAAFLGQAILLASKILTGEVLGTVQLGLAGLAAVAVIGVGYLLRTDVEASGRAEQAGDPELR